MEMKKIGPGGGAGAHSKFYYVDPPLFVHPDNEILDSGCPEDQIHHQLWPDNFVSIWNIIKERSICFVDIMTIRHSLFYLCVGDPNPCNSPKNVVPIMKTCSSCFQRNFWYLLLTSVLFNYLCPFKDVFIMIFSSKGFRSLRVTLLN